MNTCIRVFTTEITSNKNRPFFTMIVGIFAWNLGHLTFGLLVYLIPDMLWLEMIMGLVGIFFLSLYWLLYESPRWLLAKGRISEANEIIKKICQINGREFREVNPKSKEPEPGSLRQLFLFPGMRRNFLSMCLAWLSFSMGYFGLMYNTPARQGDVYLVFITPVLFSPIACALVPLLQRKFGRKLPLTASLTLPGLVMIATVFIPSHQVSILSFDKNLKLLKMLNFHRKLW